MQRQNTDKILMKNYLYNVSYRVLLIITPLITTPYVSRVLGVEGIGVFSYTNSVVTYFTLFGVLGMNMYGQREIVYVRDQKQERSKLFWELTSLRFITCAMSLIVYLILMSYENYRYAAYIWSISILANLIDISWFFYGMEKFREITIKNVIIKLLGVVAIFVFVRKSTDLLWYIFISAGTLLVGNLVLWRSIAEQVDFVKPCWRDVILHIKPVGVFFLPQAIDSVYMVLDKIMLKQLSTIEQVGLYSQADKILKLFVTIITSMGIVVSPRIAQNFQSNNEKEIKKYLEKSFEFVFLLSLPMIFGISAVSYPFVNIFFGKGYEKVSVLLTLLSPIVLLMGVNSIMGWQYLVSVKKERELLITTTIGAVSNFAFNMLLIPIMDAMGATIASVLSMILMAAINMIIMREVLDFKKLFSLLWKPLFSAILMYLVVKLVLVNCDLPYAEVIISISVGIIIYFGTNILLKEQMVIYYFKLIKGKITKSS